MILQRILCIAWKVDSHTLLHFRSLLTDKIGSLLFCPNCGSLLDVTGDEDFIKCAPCGAVQNAKGKFAILAQLLGLFWYQDADLWPLSELSSVCHNA